jgi:hypothetical protein
MIDASWVIADRSTGTAVIETFNAELCQFVNVERYRVVPIRAWLAGLNAAADAIADYAYNNMQKSEEANATFDLAQQIRRQAEALDDATNSGIESAPVGFRV